MSMPPREDSISADDASWLNILAGAPDDDAAVDPVTIAEARHLRQALIRQENEISQTLDPAVSGGLDALLLRLREASLLDTPTAPTPKEHRSIFSSWALAGALALSLLVTAIAPSFFGRETMPMTNGVDQNALVMPVENPLAHAQRLAADISQAGGNVHIRKHSNGHVMLYAEATPAVMATMRQHNMNPQRVHDMFVIAFIPMSASLSKDAPAS